MIIKHVSEFAQTARRSHQSYLDGAATEMPLVYIPEGWRVEFRHCGNVPVLVDINECTDEENIVGFACTWMNTDNDGANWIFQAPLKAITISCGGHGHLAKIPRGKAAIGTRL
jgi:hypothetical protein